MAQKDYVSRGRAPKKKAPPPSKPLPWLRIVVTVALIAGFGYFLWSIKDKAQRDPSAVTISSGQKSSGSNDEPLPELQDEVWDYPYLLSDSEVEVQVEEQQKSAKPYLMQCGSFRTREQAEKMKARIAFQGLEAQVRQSDGKNGRWFRVILGPYDYKRDAERDRHALRRINITSCAIWYWNI